MTLSAVQKPPFSRNHMLRDASYKALYDVMKADASVHLFGEGCEMKVHYDAPALERDFAERVHTLPISEDGNLNMAVGASLLGVKPVVDVISSDFLFRCMDSIANTAAKLNFVRPNEAPRTIVIRAEFFTGGPTTGQRIESLFTHIPGLRVVIPSTPREAYWLMVDALTTPGVTIYFEDREIADDGEWSAEDLSFDSPIAIGDAETRLNAKTGLTILAYGLMRQRVEKVIREFRKGWDGSTDTLPMINATLVTLPTLCPIDWDKLLNSPFTIKKSSRVLIVEPDVTYGGIGAEIAARIAERHPDIKVTRLGARKQTVPASIALHSSVMPTEKDIRDAIADLTGY